MNRRLKMSHEGADVHTLPCVICIMTNVTWRRFDQSAKQLIVGHTTSVFVVSITFTEIWAILICANNWLVVRVQTRGIGSSRQTLIEWHKRVLRTDAVEQAGLSGWTANIQLVSFNASVSLSRVHRRRTELNSSTTLWTAAHNCWIELNRIARTAALQPINFVTLTRVTNDASWNWVNSLQVSSVQFSSPTVNTVLEGEIKVAHTRLPSVGFRSWSRFLAVSLQVMWVINPAVGSHYFPPSLQLPPQPVRGPLPVLLLAEQRHNGCEQFA